MKRIFLYALSIILLFSCSVQNLVYKEVGNLLSGAGESTVFTGESDPVLVGESLPLMLKVYEAVLEKNPENTGLLVSTGSLFIMYANAFVQDNAEKLPDEEYKLYYSELDRAKSHFIRGRDYLLKALETKYNGFGANLEAGNFTILSQTIKKEDAGALYWASAGWLSAISIDVFDTAMTIEVPYAAALAVMALYADETYGRGSIHELFVQVYPSIPDYLMFSMKEGSDSWPADYINDYYLKNGIDSSDWLAKTDFHMKKSVELSGNSHAGVYVSYAAGVAVKLNDPGMYLSYLNKALEIDIDEFPETRLANTIAQARADRLIAGIGDIFILDYE